MTVKMVSDIKGGMLRILFSNTLSLRSSLSVRDHASQPYSTTGNIIVSYIFELHPSEKITSIKFKTKGLTKCFV